MGLNELPSAERVHIAFFGCRNAGKSSVVNAVTGQDLAVVSDVAGTTTDPVQKAMELLPLGPVVIIDTPGFDDEGMLGEKRVRRTRQILGRADVAVLVVDGSRGMNETDHALEALFQEKLLPYVVVYNKADLVDEASAQKADDGHQLWVSALTGEGIYQLKELLITALQTAILVMLMVLFTSHAISLTVFIALVVVIGIIFSAVTILIVRKLPPM